MTRLHGVFFSTTVTPRGLTRFLAGHIVEEARACGWEKLANGELIEAAEKAGFDAYAHIAQEPGEGTASAHRGRFDERTEAAQVTD